MNKGKAPAGPSHAHFTPATTVLAQTARTGLTTPAETPLRAVPQVPQAPVQPLLDIGTTRPQAQFQVQEEQKTQELEVPAPAPAGGNTSGTDKPNPLETDAGTGLDIPEPVKNKSPPPIPDDDSYGMLSEDDAFFAAIDLGDGPGAGVGEGGDTGVGGYIDFDEGMGGLGYESEVDDSRVGEGFQVVQRMGDVGQRRQGQGQGQGQGQQVRARVPQGQQGQQQSRRVQTTVGAAGPSGVRKEGSSDSVSEWSEHAPASSMGGFHFPGGAVCLTFRSAVLLSNGR